MNILFASGIYPPDAGGPATYTRAMARALMSQGHEVSVVAYGDQGSTDTEDGFSVTRISRSQPTWKRYLSFMRAVRMRAHNADLVYLQGPVSEGFPGTIGAMLAGKPTVMKIVGDYAWEVYMQEPGDDTKVLLDEFVQADVGARLRRAHGKSTKIRLIEFIERWTAKRAKRIIVPSEYLKGIVEKWGVSSKKIRVIYNRAKPLPEGSSRDESRQKFDVEGKRVLFTAVRAVPWKNIDFIIRLLPKLDGKDIILSIAGNGPNLEAWKAEAKKLGVQDRVKFLGRLDQKTLSEWYRAADLFILPSLYEGFPNVICEAWSQGLPCFVSDKGGNKELHAYAGIGGSILFPTGTAHIYELNENKWIDELNHPLPERFDVSVQTVQANYQLMFDETLSVLEQVIKL